MALIKLTLRVFPVAVQMGNIPPSFFVCAEFVCVSVCKGRHEEERGARGKKKVGIILVLLFTSVCARWCCERKLSPRAFNGECGSVWSIWVGKCENVKVMPLLTASFYFWQTSFRSKQTWEFFPTSLFSKYSGMKMFMHLFHHVNIQCHQ